MGASEDKAGSTEKLWSDTLKDVSDKATSAIDAGISTLSGAVRSTRKVVVEEADKAYSQAQDVYGVGKAHLEQTEEVTISKLREGVNFIVEHQNESLAAAAVLAAVVLPGPRRFLLRNTIGRLRSEEAIYKSSELRATSLADKLEGQHKELQKLQERLALAQEEYQRGLSKLRQTASELQRLSGRVHSSEKTARALLGDLRQLPSKAALQLRADVAQAASVANSQRSEIEKMVIRLAKQGV
ncbi:hypothetical protein N2152v2_006124 [Parachlorella kessleri]